MILCAGGAITTFVLTRDGDRNGPGSAESAAEQFLQAAYREQDAAQVSALVCEESRDEPATTEKINQIRQYLDGLADPTFTWSELAVTSDGDLATVETTVTVITADEKTASLLFRIKVLDKGANGWWVCDVETEPAGSGSAPPPADEPGQDEEAGSGG